MFDFETALDGYISLILELGLNLQPGQTLAIGATGSTPLPVDEVATFIRRLTEAAYRRGAHNVDVLWDDQELLRLRYQHAPEEALSDVSDWRVRRLDELMERGAAFFFPLSANPDLFQGIPPSRVATAVSARQRAFTRFVDSEMANSFSWCCAAVPTREWARKVFPRLDEAEAFDALWRYVARTMRLDTPDPQAAWHDHLRLLDDRATALTRARFARLRYRAPGTELTIELPARHRWLSIGGEVNAKGLRFAPNLPSEEVFTLPSRDGVSGTVRSTLPLAYQGQLIEGIALTFDGGRIVDYSATAGYDALKSIVETDEGSHYLGEVALVSADAPTNIGTPLFETLFDENAACHLAIGTAYPSTLEGGEQMDPEVLAANGANKSLTHVDFMIGSRDLDVEGETTDGERIAILREGLWVLDTTATQS